MKLRSYGVMKSGKSSDEVTRKSSDAVNCEL